MEKATALTLDFPSLTTRRTSLFGRKSYIFFKCSNAGMLFEFPETFQIHGAYVCFQTSTGKYSSTSLLLLKHGALLMHTLLSLRECALHCWFFLIFVKWGKLYHSSGRNEESLNWKQLFCLWSSNTRILEEMGRGGDANMYVWWRKCFEVMQLSQFLLFSQQMCQSH